MEQGGPQEPERNPQTRREQGSEPASTESSHSNTPRERKPRDPEFFRRIGSMGGKKTKEKYGREHLQSIAKEGGKANAEKNGNPHLSKIGQKGGEMTRGRYGTKHFKEIGSKGGKKTRNKRKQTPSSDEA